MQIKKILPKQRKSLTADQSVTNSLKSMQVGKTFVRPISVTESTRQLVARLRNSDNYSDYRYEVKLDRDEKVCVITRIK